MPVITTFAELSVGCALIAILSVLPPTKAVYSVTSEENAGVSVPGLIFNSESDASAELSLPPAIVILDEPCLSRVAILESLSYISQVSTVIDVSPAANALKLSL